MFGVHAVHVDVDSATSVDHGHCILQISTPTTGHQYHGVSGHDHGDRHRSILGDRSRIRAKRTAYGVRVHSYRMAAGSPDHVPCSLLSGKYVRLR